MPDIVSSSNAVVTHAPGAVLLHRYPFLAYAPLQWGDRVVTEDVGADALAVAAAVAGGKTPAEAAAAFHTTADHVRDCVRYAEDGGA